MLGNLCGPFDELSSAIRRVMRARNRVAGALLRVLDPLP